MPEDRYMNREIDNLIRGVDEKLDRIEAQTTKTNGRVSKLEQFMIIVGCVVGTMLIMSGSRFIDLLQTFL